MKKIFGMMWMIILAFVIVEAPLSLKASAASPSSPSIEKHVLKPSKHTEKVLKKVSLSMNNNVYHMSISNNIEKGDTGFRGYHIQIDPKTMTYTITKIKQERVQEEEPKNNVSIPMIPSRSPFSSSHRVPSSTVPSMLQKTATTQVKAVTHDPLGADLVWTIHQLTWNYDGTNAYKDATEGSCNYASPSIFGSHWFNDSCQYDGYDVIDGGQAVTVTGHGYYHNYDFGNNSKITNVSHTVYIEGHGDGSSYYNVDWTKSGEFTFFLGLDVYEYNN